MEVKPRFGIVSGYGHGCTIDLCRYIHDEQKRLGKMKDSDFPSFIITHESDSVISPNGSIVDLEAKRNLEESSCRTFSASQVNFYAVLCNTLHAFDFYLPHMTMISLPSLVVEKDVVVLCTQITADHRLYGDVSYMVTSDLIESCVSRSASSEQVDLIASRVRKEYPDKRVVLGCTDLCCLEEIFKDRGFTVINPVRRLAETMVRMNNNEKMEMMR